jgi:hypothetical protein
MAGVTDNLKSTKFYKFGLLYERLDSDYLDHYVELEDHELWEPNKNICAAVRWLFRKRDKAEGRLERKPTWEEVLIEYKGRTKSKTEETKRIKSDIRRYLKEMGEN